MEKFRNMGQKTLGGIMALVILFLIADIAVFILMYFNIDLGISNKNKTDNTALKSLTDNTVIISVTPKITVRTDNVAK